MNLTSREALRMFDVANIWAARTGQEVRLVSANDHVIHSRGSAHNPGLALGFQSPDAERLAMMFRLAGYRVLWNVPGHYGHVHVEQEGSTGHAAIPTHLGSGAESHDDAAPTNRRACGRVLKTIGPAGRFAGIR